ncbi:lipoxygenase homology domain-containing protein 1-like [Littorina saxatilis]|uniref:Uncharacterized protein n=1 Tax=Littorina saxatilis TaxID=31220 RepID=A0AAN9B5Y4_9CAEN
MATSLSHHVDEGDEDEDNRNVYKMDAEPRGICVIINNKDFTKDSSNPMAQELTCRTGTDEDKDRLKSTFEGLKFEVRDFDNLTSTDLIKKIRDIAMENHTPYDCLVVCILSHGSLGNVYGCDGVPVALKDVTFHVKPQNCHSLSGKPKLFFVQACQGKDRQIGYPSLERDTSPMADVELVPNEGDFLLSYSTVPGYESYRNPDRGSTFIYNLTWYLRKYAVREDILHILTRVNNAVASEHHTLDNNHAYKQCPAPLYSLRKKVFFGTGVSSSTFGIESRFAAETTPQVAEADVASKTAAIEKKMGQRQGSTGSQCSRSENEELEPLALDQLKIGMARRYSCLDTSISCRSAVLCEVKVTTGDVPEAETDAAVYITLFGIKGTTLPIELQKGRVGSTRGGTDTLKLQMQDVSPVKKLRVSVDPGDGKKTLWFLDKIEIWNMSTFTETAFYHEDWLGTGKEGAKTWVDIPATERNRKLLEGITYKITVKTSNVNGAGTDSNVFVVLFGVNGDSGELHLKKSEKHRDPFEKGHVDVFTFKNILSLGELYKLRVWHDSKGFGAAWHLSSIEVRDESTSKVYKFCCDCWLPRKDDRKDDLQPLQELTCTQPSGLTGDVVYEIEVKTSVEENSGTVHNGWLVLEGDIATSNIFPLDNTDHNRIFRRGQTNFFTVSSPSLGNLKTCRIGASKREDRPIQIEKGDQARWRCEQVAVTDTSSGIRTTFPCDSWIKVLPLPISGNDGKVCCALRSEETHWAKARNLTPVMYEVAVFTVEVQGGGTDANVSICIYGENGDTGKRPLKKRGRNLFESGNGDKFELEALDLGELTQVHIEHDNSGIAPAWFLDHVVITNMETHSPTFFSCRKWLNEDSNNAQDLRPSRSGSP